MLRHQLWIVLAAGVVCFTNLGSTRLWDEDETLYASIAREMLQSGDWVRPMFNGNLFPEKPPLMFWTIMNGFQLFGVTEFGARFWSAVFGVGTALATYHLGRLLFRAEVGFWAGLATASTLIFAVSARAATVDSALVLVTTLAMLALVVGGVVPRAADASGKEGKEKAPEEREDNAVTPGIHREQWSRLYCTPHAPREVRHHAERDEYNVHREQWARFCTWACVYVCLGVAVLAKGPVGLLLPAAAIGLFLLVMNRPQREQRPVAATRIGRWSAAVVRAGGLFEPRRFLRTVWQMRPVTAIVVVGLVALPWYVLVGVRTEGAWLQGFFAKFNLRPFLQPILGHHGPIYYYIPAILAGFFPWSVVLVPALVQAARRIGQRHAWRPGYVLAACWLGVFFVFWSICSTKLPHYLLPAYPALALLVGCWVDGWLAEPSSVSRASQRTAAITLSVVGVAIVIAVPIVTSYYLPGEALLALVGLPLVVGGGACLYFVERGRPRQVVVSLAVTAVAFVTAAFGFAALGVDRHQNAPSLAAAIRRDSPETPQISAFRYFRQSMVFYTGQNVRHFDDPDELCRFLAESPNPYVITTDAYLSQLDERLPGRLIVLARERCFLRREDILVLACRGAANFPLFLAWGRAPFAAQRPEGCLAQTAPASFAAPRSLPTPPVGR